jgi:hypothetical protein
MSRNSFRAPVTGVLKAHGFVETNDPGDVKMAVAEDFNLTPGQWKWDGSAWVPFTPPPLTDAEKDAQLQGHVDGNKVLAAIVRWQATLHGKTIAEAVAEIKAIYRALP